MDNTASTEKDKPITMAYNLFMILEIKNDMKLPPKLPLFKVLEVICVTVGSIMLA